MNNLKEIAAEIYDHNKTKSYEELAKKIESNLQLIQSFDYKESAETYDIYSQLIANYGIALSETENYTKAIPKIEKALELFKNNPIYSQETINEVKFYEILIFNHAICNYYLNNIDKSKEDFKILVKLYPNNMLYSKWIEEINKKST